MSDIEWKYRGYECQILTTPSYVGKVRVPESHPLCSYPPIIQHIKCFLEWKLYEEFVFRFYRLSFEHCFYFKKDFDSKDLKNNCLPLSEHYQVLELMNIEATMERKLTDLEIILMKHCKDFVDKFECIGKKDSYVLY